MHQLLWALGTVAAIVLLLTAVRATRWHYLSRSPVVVWTAGSVNRLSVDAFDILWYSAWYSAFFDPQRLADTAYALAQNWARRRAAGALLGSMHHIMHRLWADIGGWDALPGATGAIHSEIAAALQDSLNGLESAANHMHEHLAGWMDHARGHSHVNNAVIDAAHHGTGQVIDASGAVSSFIPEGVGRVKRGFGLRFRGCTVFAGHAELAPWLPFSAQVPCSCERAGWDRVGGEVAPPPPTPPDMRARIRRFVKPSD